MIDGGAEVDRSLWRMHMTSHVAHALVFIIRYVNVIFNAGAFLAKVLPIYVYGIARVVERRITAGARCIN